MAQLVLNNNHLLTPFVVLDLNKSLHSCLSSINYKYIFVLLIYSISFFFDSSFGLIPANPLQIQSPLPSNQTASTSLVLSTTGPIQKMEPLTNLQVYLLLFIQYLFIIPPRNEVVEGYTGFTMSVRL